MPNNTATRAQHVIEWVNEHGTTLDKTISSTRASRARRHLERLRGTRRADGLNPRMRIDKTLSRAQAARHLA